MNDTSKYLIHAAITANGVVERSDVVGAIFGQTEGLLGDELDLRDLQQSSKVGRIDVEVASEGGQSFGEVTIASSLDRVRTAIVAAALETITRVGPCRARVEVTDIEDVREAKRREIVERAKELLAESFDESVMTSDEIREEVREAVRVENISEYAGLPAGPRVVDSDAVILVEGRADVLTLLKYGIKNAVGVEGTDVPDEIAELTDDRTVTAFLDGDRGGELILRELAQVGDIDYVAFAPEGRSVEDLDRHEVMDALRAKVRVDRLPAEGDIRAAVDDGELDAGVGEGDSAPPRSRPPETEAPAADDGANVTTVADATGDVAAAVGEAGTTPLTESEGAVGGDDESTGSEPSGSGETTPSDGADAEHEPVATDGTTDSETGEDGHESDGVSESRPRSVGEHVREVIAAESGRVRLLDDELATVGETDGADAFDAIEGAESTPFAVVLDGNLSQRVLDVSAQRGVEQFVARTTGEFVKRPVDVRIRTAEEFTEASRARPRGRRRRRPDDGRPARIRASGTARAPRRCRVRR
jgi:hypothetical protein